MPEARGGSGGFGGRGGDWPLPQQLGAHLVEHVYGLQETLNGYGEAQRRLHPGLFLLSVDTGQPQEIETDNTIGDGNVAQTVYEQIGHDTPRVGKFAVTRQVSASTSRPPPTD